MSSLGVVMAIHSSSWHQLSGIDAAEKHCKSDAKQVCCKDMAGASCSMCSSYRLTATDVANICSNLSTLALSSSELEITIGALQIC